MSVFVKALFQCDTNYIIIDSIGTLAAVMKDSNESRIKLTRFIHDLADMEKHFKFALVRDRLEFRDFDGLGVKFTTEHIETKSSQGSQLRTDIRG